uniref:MIP08155p n=1 Tax=Drosophila melanogaster TaxID=7227 RepID=D5SHT4_DROME|nr:MIP08155p [Drosophila melanogaster]
MQSQTGLSTRTLVPKKNKKKKKLSYETIRTIQMRKRNESNRSESKWPAVACRRTAKTRPHQYQYQYISAKVISWLFLAAPMVKDVH